MEPEMIEVRVAPVALQGGPQEVMARLLGHAHHALLESALDLAGLSTWSFIAGPACAVLQSNDDHTWLEQGGQVQSEWDNPFDALQAVVLPQAPLQVRCDAGEPPAGLDFIGGWAGVLGYDTARHLHRFSNRALADTALPQMYWMAANQVLAFHHPSKQWWQCTARGPTDAWPWTNDQSETIWSATLAVARGPTPPRQPWRVGSTTRQTDETDFKTGVQTIRDHIANGDMLQVNLTRREDALFEGDAWSLYQDLVAAHPAPFCAYLQAPGFAIASCSPERFLQLRGRHIQARPIKGTVARGANPQADASLRAWLAASEKNRAENLMIVDLMRNDIGRVAAVGSVRVPQLFALEAHASVWQMVSTVEAQLKPELNAIDLLRACWPPGSMTGAPKLAALQTIDTLEPVQRGFYSGSIGYFDCRGHMDLSVVIRTAIVHAGKVMVQVGGGIVADSDPTSEWHETVVKGERLFKVLNEHAGLASR
jgi:para-aminobenzoate synthetase component I